MVKKQQDRMHSGTDDRYSGVRLRCRKCGIVKLTMDELQKLVLVNPDSRRCPTCGSIAVFV